MTSMPFLSHQSIQKAFPALISLAIIIAVLLWFNQTYTNQPLSFNFSSRDDAGFSLTVPEKIHLNQPFTAAIAIDTQQHTVNAVGMVIKYETDNLRVTNIDTTKSFCQFYPEKRVNDSAGTIGLSCGSPSPGFTGQNEVLIIEFMPIKVGTTSIVIDPQSKILKSDGKGTNIVSQFPQQTITIVNTL